MNRTVFYFKGLILVGLLITSLSACKNGSVTSTLPNVGSTSEISSSTTDSSTPIPTISPSATPIPLAARVNGSEITLAEYQSELALYQAAKGIDLAPEDKKRVLDNLIDETILVQAAAEKGFAVDDAILQEHMKQLEARRR